MEEEEERMRFEANDKYFHVIREKQKSLKILNVIEYNEDEELS
jgi:hypothetical protein